MPPKKQQAGASSSKVKDDKVIFFTFETWVTKGSDMLMQNIVDEESIDLRDEKCVF